MPAAELVEYRSFDEQSSALELVNDGDLLSKIEFGSVDELVLARGLNQSPFDQS